MIAVLALLGALSASASEPLVCKPRPTIEARFETSSASIGVVETSSVSSISALSLCTSAAARWMVRCRTERGAAGGVRSMSCLSTWSNGQYPLTMSIAPSKAGYAGGFAFGWRSWRVETATCAGDVLELSVYGDRAAEAAHIRSGADELLDADPARARVEAMEALTLLARYVRAELSPGSARLPRDERTRAEQEAELSPRELDPRAVDLFDELDMAAAGAAARQLHRELAPPSSPRLLTGSSSDPASHSLMMAIGLDAEAPLSLGAGRALPGSGALSMELGGRQDNLVFTFLDLSAGGHFHRLGIESSATSNEDFEFRMGAKVRQLFGDGRWQPYLGGGLAWRFFAARFHKPAEDWSLNVNGSACSLEAMTGVRVALSDEGSRGVVYFEPYAGLDLWAARAGLDGETTSAARDAYRSALDRWQSGTSLSFGLRVMLAWELGLGGSSDSSTSGYQPGASGGTYKPWSQPQPGPTVVPGRR